MGFGWIMGIMGFFFFFLFFFLFPIYNSRVDLI